MHELAFIIMRMLDFFMTKRITVMLDDEVIQKLRKLQAKQIQDSTSSVSLSKVINDALKKNLKN